MIIENKNLITPKEYLELVKENAMDSIAFSEDQYLTPAEYMKRITGEEIVLISTNEVEGIEVTLEERGFCLWSHCLEETEYVIKEELEVVLVKCESYNYNTMSTETVYRWFELE